MKKRMIVGLAVAGLSVWALADASHHIGEGNNGAQGMMGQGVMGQGVMGEGMMAMHQQMMADQDPEAMLAQCQAMMSAYSEAQDDAS